MLAVPEYVSGLSYQRGAVWFGVGYLGSGEGLETDSI